jgi:hypothetical protein
LRAASGTKCPRTTPSTIAIKIHAVNEGFFNAHPNRISGAACSRRAYAAEPDGLPIARSSGRPIRTPTAVRVLRPFVNRDRFSPEPAACPPGKARVISYYFYRYYSIRSQETRASNLQWRPSAIDQRPLRLRGGQSRPLIPVGSMC